MRFQRFIREFICELEIGYLLEDDVICLIFEKGGLEGKLTFYFFSLFKFYFINLDFLVGSKFVLQYFSILY